jgi:putative xaa-pro dipeptidase
MSMQEAEEKTTDVFYRFCKRDILKENGLRQLELVVCRGRAVHKPAPKRNKTVDALLDPYLA